MCTKLLRSLVRRVLPPRDPSGPGRCWESEATLGRVYGKGRDVVLGGAVPCDPAVVAMVSAKVRCVDDFSVFPNNALLPVHTTVTIGAANGLVES